LLDQCLAGTATPRALAAGRPCLDRLADEIPLELSKGQLARWSAAEGLVAGWMAWVGHNPDVLAQILGSWKK